MSTTVDWLPGYEHQPIPNAGHSPLPGARKVILHTTETDYGALQPLINSWSGNWGSGLPHFIQEANRIVQLLPLSTCAYTSKAGPDQANKTGTPIQIEIVGRSAKGLNDVEYETLGKWIGDLMLAGIPLDLDGCPKFFGPGEGFILASESSPVRSIIRDYESFNSICGHQHLKGNDHWDPGALDIHRVCDIARRRIVTVTSPSTTISEDENMKVDIIVDGRPGQLSMWQLFGITKRKVQSNLAPTIEAVARSGKVNLNWVGLQGAGSDWILRLDTASELL